MQIYYTCQGIHILYNFPHKHYNLKVEHLVYWVKLRRWTIKGDRYIFRHFLTDCDGYASPLTTFCMEITQPSLPGSGVHIK